MLAAFAKMDDKKKMLAGASLLAVIGIAALAYIYREHLFPYEGFKQGKKGKNDEESDEEENDGEEEGDDDGFAPFSP
jgi:hypothetical protein